MKKFLCSLAIFCAGYFSATAQKQINLELGGNIGYNFSTVNSKHSTNNDFRNSFNVGLVADYYFSNRWGIKMKLIYDQKGWDDGFLSFLAGSNTTNFHMNYLTVPLMANWHFGKTRNWYLNFGPYAGFLLNVKETALDTDIKQYFKSTDFGLAFGIGVKLPVSETAKINIEYDGQSGLSDIIKNNSGSSIRNIRGAFNVGLVFSID